MERAKKALLCLGVGVTALTFALCFPILLVILSPFLLLRLVVSLLAKCTRLEKMVSPLSVLMTMGAVHSQPKNILVVPLLVKGTPDISFIREVVQKKLIEAKIGGNNKPKFPELRQDIVNWMGFLFWKNVENFRLEDHVYLYETSEEITQLVKDFAGKSWRKGKALWEIAVVPNVRPWSPPEQVFEDETFLFLFRFHHGLVDGFSVLKILQCLDQSGNMQDLLTSKNKKVVQDSRMVRYTKSFSFMVKAPWDLAYSFLVTPKPHPLPFHSVKQPLANSCSRASILFSIRELKDTKTNLGISFTTLLTVIIAQGLRHLLEERVGLEKLKGRNIPFRFPILRKGLSENLENKVSFGGFNINFGESDPVKKCIEVESQFQHMLCSTLPTTMSFLTLLGGSLPHFLTKPMVAKALKEYHIFVGNFPAPEKQFDVCGFKIVDGQFSGTVAGTRGILFEATTSQKYLSITVGADASIISNDHEAQRLLHLCQQEFQTLKILSGKHQVV